MPALSINVPFPVFQDRDGQPLDNGYVYIGTPYLDPQTNPVQVYFDDALTIPAAQPLRTINGYVSNAGTPAQLYVNGVNFSIKLLDSKANLVYSFPDGSGISPNASGIQYDPAGTGAVATTVQAKLRESVSVKDFGAVGNGIANDTTALQAAVTYAVSNGKALYIPSGTYLYSSLTGLDQNNIVIVGDGSGLSVLKFTGTGIALDLGTVVGFRQGINLSGFTVEGNSNVTAIVRATAIARCQWTDINVREANQATGVGFVFRGCQLSRFDSLMCSQDRQAMTNPPAEGFNIEALAPYGNSSNNTFTNLYAEGAGAVATTIDIGVRISGGDQNTFIGGSPESCGIYGLLVSANCRYNTFINVGFENLNATADFADAGLMNRYINCYASQKSILQGSLCEIAGGYYERVQIDAGAIKNKVHDIILNHWATGAGGLFDSGTGTETQNVYDEDAAVYLTDIYPRFLLSLNSTTNNVTGNSAVYTVAFNEIFDDNNNCNGTIFTAPVKGRYQLQSTLTLTGVDSAATTVTVRIVTTSRNYITTKRLNLPAGSHDQQISVSAVADMNVGDTAYVTIQVDGMAGNTVDLLGNATNAWCTFSGHKIH